MRHTSVPLSKIHSGPQQQEGEEQRQEPTKSPEETKQEGTPLQDEYGKEEEEDEFYDCFDDPADLHHAASQQQLVTLTTEISQVYEDAKSSQGVSDGHTLRRHNSFTNIQNIGEVNENEEEDRDE